MAKATVCTKDYSIEDKSATFEFADGVGSLAVKLDELRGVLTNLALHGLVQKIGDCYAGEKDPKEAFNKASDLLERLKKGEWSKARESKGPSTALVVEAVARLRGATVNDIQVKWDKMDDENKKRIQGDNRVKAEMARIKAERLEAKAKGETDGETEDALAAFS